MVFWIVTGAMALGVSALLVLALLRGRADEEPPAAYDMRVYRDQLKEVDRDLARGIIGEGEAERLRTEVSRRLLAADAQMQAAQAGETKRGPAGYAVGGLVLASLLGGSLWLYAQLGAPGYPDLALADRIAAAEERRQTRPTQAEAEAEAPPMAPPVAVPDNFADLVQRLRGAVAERPGDLQGQILLARNEAALGNFTAAYKAQEQVLNLKGEAATASDYADYGDMLVLAAGGYVSPKAESAFREALAREPSNGTALYYIGSMMMQTGRPDQAFRIWERQLRQGPPDAPWIAPIRAQIENAAQLAGVDYTLPDAPPAGQQMPGPSAADMAAAADMTPEERLQMIEGMVSGLGARLAEDGGTPDEWARLIRALGVLGRTDQAAAIWAEAQGVFGENPGAMDTVRAAAQDAGVAQ